MRVMIGTVCRNRFSQGASRRIKAIAGLAALLGLPMALLAYLHFSVGTEPFPIGEMLPSLQLASLNLDPVVLDSTGSKKLVLLFFTTGCLYCKRALLNLDVLNRRYQSQVIMMGISLDGAVETQQLAAKQGPSFPVVVDLEGSVRELCRIQQVPTLFYLDERLALRNRKVGARSIEEDERDLKLFLDTRHEFKTHETHEPHQRY